MAEVTNEILAELNRAVYLMKRGYVSETDPWVLAKKLAEIKKVINNTEQKVAETTFVPKHNN